MLKEKPDSSIIKEPGNHGGQQQPEFESLELSFAGKHYLAVPARIDSDCGVCEKVNVVNMGGCLIRGSLVIDQKRYFVISDDCKEKVISGNDHIWEILTDRELQIAILVQ